VEFSVYDSPATRVRLAIVGAVVAGMVASFITVFLASQGTAARDGRRLPEQLPILVIPVVLIVGLMLIMMTLGVRLRIERGMGEVPRVIFAIGPELASAEVQSVGFRACESLPGLSDRLPSVAGRAGARTGGVPVGDPGERSGTSEPARGRVRAEGYGSAIA